MIGICVWFMSKFFAKISNGTSEIVFVLIMFKDCFWCVVRDCCNWVLLAWLLQKIVLMSVSKCE